MYDDRPLVDLINARLDDVISRMESMKTDLLRESQELKRKHEEHEDHDLARFTELDQIKWKSMGAFSAVLVIFQLAIEILFKK